MRPVTAVSLGALVGGIGLFGGIFAWVDSRYVSKEVFSAEIEHVSHELSEINMMLREIRQELRK